MITDRKLKVVYIVGFGRSGSTILGNLLGEIDGFFHMGELCHLWPRIVRSIGKCGCDNPIPECSFWSRVLSRTFALGAHDVPFRNPPADATASYEKSSERAWAIQKQAARQTLWRNRMHRRSSGPAAEFAGLMERLLHDVAKVSGARVLIDSSKVPAAGLYLRSIPSVVPYYLHMVRDSRGSVLSRQRRQALREGERILLDAVTATADSLRWMRRNAAAEVLRRSSARRSKILLYESFASRPEPTLKAIVDWLGEERGTLPFLDSRTAWIGSSHTVCGNRNRFRRGEVPICVDDMWMHALRRRDFLLITSLTAPLLVRYGYPLKRGRPGALMPERSSPGATRDLLGIER